MANEASASRMVTPEEMARVIAFFEILMKVDRRARIKESDKQNRQS
jgi:hypothetical protein